MNRNFCAHKNLHYFHAFRLFAACRVNLSCITKHPAEISENTRNIFRVSDTSDSSLQWSSKEFYFCFSFSSAREKVVFPRHLKNKQKSQKDNRY